MPFMIILFWDYPQTGLALVAQHINLILRVKKSIYSKQLDILLEVLAEARRNAGLTQQQLAHLLKKPQSFVAKYESGQRRLDVIEFLTISKTLKIMASKIISRLE